MEPDVVKLLFDMRQASRYALQFIVGKCEADYLADVLLRSAVERQLFILGEALTQLRHRDAHSAEQIPGCRAIIGFRNILAHAYDAVDDRRVWEIVEQSLPQTLASVEALLPDEPSEGT